MLHPLAFFAKIKRALKNPHIKEEKTGLWMPLLSEEVLVHQRGTAPHFFSLLIL
jgi:hypothetical protein